MTKIRGNVPDALNFIGAIVTFNPDSLEVLKRDGRLEKLEMKVHETTQFVHCVTWPGATYQGARDRTVVLLPRATFEEYAGGRNWDFYYSQADGRCITLNATQYTDHFRGVKFNVAKLSIWRAHFGNLPIERNQNVLYQIPHLGRKVFLPDARNHSGFKQTTVLGTMLVWNSSGGVLPSLALSEPKDSERDYVWHILNEPLREQLRFSRPRTNAGSHLRAA